MRILNFRGLSQVAFAVALAASLFASGCSDDDSPEPPDVFAAPTSLTFQNGDGEVILRWNSSADETFDEFVGYNVYQSSATMVGLSNAELADLLVNVGGVLSAATSSFVVTGLTNGELGYFAVRSVHENGSVSAGDAEARTASVNRGTLEVSEFTSSNPSAVDLSAGVAVSQIADNLVLVDLYVGTDAVDDASSGQLVLKSPHLVDGSGVWDARNASFKELDGPNVSETAIGGFIDSIVLGSTSAEIEDRVFAVKIPIDVNDEVHYGKVEILQVTNLDTPGARTLTLRWTFQPAVNVPIF